MASAKHPSFEQVQREITGYTLALAVLANECVSTGAGNRMLGIGESDSLGGLLDKFDPAQVRMSRFLSVYYEYAYNARVPAGHERTIDLFSNMAERLIDFAQMFGPDSSYFDLCMDVVGLDANSETGFLKDMIERWKARFALDDGAEVSIAQLAILADMNERSVRNAASVEGDGGLKLNQSQSVDNHEARRWLSGRRGYEPTVHRQFPEEPVAANAQLAATEIPAYVAKRLGDLYSESALDEWAMRFVRDGTYDVAVPEGVAEAAKIAGLAPQALARAMHLPLHIEPTDCEAIAKAIQVDPIWFTLQVMSALYPKPMDMILNPAAYRHGKELPPDTSTIEFTFELTQPMIEHGYLDFSSDIKSMFPGDCFGTREATEQGSKVEIRYGGSSVETDIREKSSKTLSPRHRFGAWLKTSLGARPGDQMKLTKLSDRVFELTYLRASS